MKNEKDAEAVRLYTLRQKLFDGLKEIVPGITINGTMENRHPGNLNCRLPDFAAKQLFLAAQSAGVAFSTGSACNSGVVETSYVLKAIGLSNDEAKRSFRISVGRFTEQRDIEQVVAVIKGEA
jgi:cysteine desulfurase